MLVARRSLLRFALPFLTVGALLAAAVWHVGYRQALDRLAQRGTAEMALVTGGLVAELQRYRDLAVALADNPALTALTRAKPEPGARARAERVLLAAADRTGAAALYFADAQGRVLAGSRREAPPMLRRTAHFRRAMDGALGASHGVTDAGPGDTARRRFHFAAPSFAARGGVQGAVVVIADAETVEIGWRAGRIPVALFDAGGRVFLSNRSELLGWRLDGAGTGLIGADGVAHRVVPRKLGGHVIWRLDLGPYLPARALLLTRPVPRIGMTGAALVDIAPARHVATLQAGALAALLLFFGALLYFAQERRRSLARANASLEARVAERTVTLTRTNQTLRREVHERHEAEAALRRAQAELVQAGKLSALGKMSAGISHELNQPLMAIRQFAANAAAFLDRGTAAKAAENLRRIDDMAGRMGRIIRNLRAFARNEAEPMGKVDIVQVTESALEMTSARLARDGVAVDWQKPDAPVWVRGGEVRLGQVLLNLISNGADAMSDSPEKRLRLRIDAPGADSRVTLRVADTGPGIEEPERIFDPFYSTKAVRDGDEGMGLGLSISYGLVQSFGGNIRGTNTAAGAEFTIELEPWRDNVAPDQEDAA